mmetsp:Transcript_28121/g.52527  ORF Transcript_28121/g.52527 Transcript_28121/m.52527 type:complete len:285 (+) Transcript_28121:145-999(+)
MHERELLSRTHPHGDYKLNARTNWRSNKSWILPRIHWLLTIGPHLRLLPVCWLLAVYLHGLHWHRLSTVRVLCRGCDRNRLRRNHRLRREHRLRSRLPLDLLSRSHRKVAHFVGDVTGFPLKFELGSAVVFPYFNLIYHTSFSVLNFQNFVMGIEGIESEELAQGFIGLEHNGPVAHASAQVQVTLNVDQNIIVSESGLLDSPDGLRIVRGQATLSLQIGFQSDSPCSLFVLSRLEERILSFFSLVREEGVDWHAEDGNLIISAKVVVLDNELYHALSEIVAVD